jgi:hypothetical protein
LVRGSVALPSATGWNTTLRDKNDLAGGAGFEDLFVGAGGFGERQLFADDWAQGAVFEASDEASMDLRFFRWCNCPKREASGRSATRHQVARVDGGLAAIANDDRR